MPPPAEADVSVAQLTVALDEELDDALDEELDEQPVASSVRAATPANANLYGDLTSASLKSFPVTKRTAATRPSPGGAEGVCRPTRPQLRVQDKRV
jgi:hypothetical protein